MTSRLIVILTVGGIIFLMMIGIEGIIFTKVIFTEPITIEKFEELIRDYSLSIDSFQYISLDNPEMKKRGYIEREKICSLPQKARITDFVMVGWIPSELKGKPIISKILTSFIRHPYD